MFTTTDTTVVRFAADGRTITVTGMPGTHYAASDAHHQVVAVVAATPAPIATAQTATYTPTNATQASSVSAGAMSAAAVATLVLGLLIGIAVKNNKVKLGWVFASSALGVLLAGTFVGPLVQQLAGAGATSWGSIFGSL